MPEHFVVHIPNYYPLQYCTLLWIFLQWILWIYTCWFRPLPFYWVWSYSKCWLNPATR